MQHKQNVKPDNIGLFYSEHFIAAVSSKICILVINRFPGKNLQKCKIR